MSKKTDLVTAEAAGETLGLDAAEVDEMIERGDLRKVWHRAGNDSEAPLDSFVMASDVRRLQQESDPRYLARLVRGEVTLPDADGDTPESLAKSVGRL